MDVLTSALAGGSAGILTDLIFFPIETIKTRIQASNSKVNYTVTASSVSKYRGLMSQMLVSFPYAFIFFGSYDTAKRNLARTPLSPELVHMLAGAFGETMSNLFKNPFEVVKNQMQVGLDATIRDTVRGVFKAQGMRGFYAGFSSILLREIPFSAIQFPIYERMKKTFGNEDARHYAVNGFVAGGIAAFLTTPCDVIKSKLMTQRSQFYANIFDCIRQIARQDGIGGFFKAAHLRTAQISVSGVVFFSAYEQSKYHINQLIS